MKIWAMDIEALDGAGDPETLRFSSGDYTQVEAGPAHRFYEPRLIQPSMFTVAAITGPLLPSMGDNGLGEAVLVNADGGLDYLADYALDGRSMTLRVIDDGSAITAINGTVLKMVFSGSRVTVQLRDPLAELDKTIPANRFAGDNSLPNGVEGTSQDIGGTRKPLVFGSVVNATPVMVNTSKLIYQVHDGSDVTITEVRDRGVVLTFESTASDLTDLLTTAPAAGKWRRFEGYFSLGSAGQLITCDAERDSVGAGDVFEELADLMGFTVASADVTALNAVGDVGFYLAEDRPARDALSAIAHGCGAYWAHNGTDIRVLSLAAPGTVDITIEDWQILELNRKATGSGPDGLPVPKITLRADRIETVQNDVASSVANPARYASEYRETTSSDSAVATRHPLATELAIDGLLRDLGDAGSVASTLLPLLKVRRDITESIVQLDDLSVLFVGATVSLETERLGYPRSFVLLGWTVNARRNRVTLYLWG